MGNKMQEVILEMHKDEVPIKTIAKYLKTTEEYVSHIIETHSMIKGKPSPQ